MENEKKIPILLDWKTWRDNYGGSRALFYRLVNRADVPSVTIGGRKFLIRDQFDAWLKAQQTNGGGRE